MNRFQENQPQESQDQSGSMADHLNLQRWLIEHGLFTDEIKNSLYAYGALAHQSIDALHVSIDHEKAVVHYKLYCPTKLLENVARYNQWKNSSKIFDMWRLKRLLKKERNLDFQSILTTFVRDLCGKRWNVTVKLEDVASFVDSPVDDDLGTNADKATD
jgi:hypothetical protein